MFAAIACGTDTEVTDPEPLPVFVADDAEINLAEAVKPEAGTIIQLVRNVPVGLSKFFDYSPAQPVPGYTWPARQTVAFHMPTRYAGQEYLTLTLDGIHVTNFGPIDWTDSSVVKTDTVSHAIDNISIPKDSDFSKTYTYSFSAVQTVEKSTTEGLEVEAKAKLGPEYASFDFATKVKLEAEQKFGQEQTFAESDSQTFSFKGPRNIQIEAVRSRQILRRDASSLPQYDYSITFSTRYVQSATVSWANRAEFISWVQGKAPDDVGVIHWSDMYGHPRPEQDVHTAAGRRSEPQPKAAIPNTGPAIAPSVEYVNVTNQAIVAQDTDTGLYTHPLVEGEWMELDALMQHPAMVAEHAKKWL